jgi:hypothetical protein
MAAGEKILKVIFAADSKAIDKAFASIESHSSSLQQKIGKLGHGMASAGKVMSTGLTLPVVAGFGFAYEAAVKFDQANAITAAGIRASGAAAHVSAAHVAELSDHLGMIAAISPQVVHGAENVLLAFTGVANVGVHKVFDAASLAALNLSTKMKVGLVPATKAIGKALSDPIHGTTALTRVGIILNEHQKTLIKTWEAHGQKLRAQEYLLGLVHKRTGDAAAASGKAAGVFAHLGVVFEILKVKIGEIIKPYVEKLGNFIKGLADRFSQLSPHAQRMVVLIAAVAAAIGPLLIVLGTLAIAIGAISLPMVIVGAGVAALAVVIYRNWASISAFIHKHAKAISQVIHITWAAIKLATKIAWAAIQLAVIHPIQMLVKIIIPIVKFIADHWKATWQRMKDVFSGVWNGLVAIARGPLNLLIGLLNLVISALDDVIHGFNMIPGVPDIPPIPHIPKLAAGTASFAGGLALVGERGPELVGLGRGAAVLNAGSTRQVMGGGDINVVVHVHGSVSAERDLAQSIRRELIRAARNNSGRIGLA